MTSTQNTTTPRVWIGCLAAYNAGDLHGEWTDADDLDTLNEVGARVLRTSPAHFAEELFLADHEGFGGLIGEFTPFGRVAELAGAIEEHGAPFVVYCSQIRGDVDGQEVPELVEEFEEACCGEYDTLKDYAYELVDDCGWAGLEKIPDELEPYIDWDAIANALDCDGYHHVAGYVFRPV